MKFVECLPTARVAVNSDVVWDIAGTSGVSAAFQVLGIVAVDVRAAVWFARSPNKLVVSEILNCIILKQLGLWGQFR